MSRGPSTAPRTGPSTALRTGPSTALRTGDWEQALAAYFAACERKPYAWGEHDCVLFAAGAVLAVTGEDPAAAIRGRYRSKAGAARLLRELGAGTLEATLDSLFPERPVAFARRGDLALHDGAIGVVSGRFALFVGAFVASDPSTPTGSPGDGEGPEEPQLLRVARADWQKVWAVE